MTGAATLRNARRALLGLLLVAFLVIAGPSAAVVLDTFAVRLHVPVGSDPRATIASLRKALPPPSELATGYT